MKKRKSWINTEATICFHGWWFKCAALLITLLAPTADARPNFLLIVADDLCWRDLGFTGNRDVSTPNIDQMASDGMILRGMFSPASSCSPTRHALYTGIYPIRSGAYPNHTRVDPNTQSIFTHLKTMGYRVGLQGKTHVNPAESFPFEYLGDDLDDESVFKEFINRDKSQPWLTVYASRDPHSPWDRGPKNLYDPSKLLIPPYLHDNLGTRKLLAAYYAEITQLDAQVGSCLRALDETGQNDNTLVIFVSEQGSSFPYGGKWTLYDNGIKAAAIARWPNKIKSGASSDSLMQYVDIPPTFIEAAGGNPLEIDTGCPNVAGGTGFDGRSFLSVLTGETNEFRDYIYAQHTTVGLNGYKEPYPERTVRDYRYKLIKNLAPQNEFVLGRAKDEDGGQLPWRAAVIMDSWEADAHADPSLAKRIEWFGHRPAEEFYDLHTDPFEMVNLASDPEFAHIRKQLSTKLELWMKQQGDQGMKTELNALLRQP